MAITVTPQQFTYVNYDPAAIVRVAADLMDRLGLSDRDLEIEVDETTPLSRVRVRFDDRTIRVRVESGAFENLQHLRELSEVAVATSLGRLLLRVADRVSGRFANAPADDELTLAQIAAWDACCLGRLGRMGIPVNQQRWRYNFRNRHGFTDDVDATFERLWNSDDLTWADLQSTSAAV